MQPAQPPPVWPVFVSFAAVSVLVGAGSVAVFVIGVAYVGATLPADQRPALDELTQLVIELPWITIASLSVSVVTLTAASLILPKLEGASIRERLRYVPTGRDLALGLVGAVLVMGSGQVMDSLGHIAGLMEGSSLDLIADLVRSLHPAWFVVLLVLGSVGPGVGEELFFRGYAQTRLVARWGRWTGILVTSALFGLIHLDPIHTPMAFLIGIVLGWMAETSGSVRPGMIAHGVNNATSFLFQRLTDPQELSATTHALLGGVGLAVAIAAALGMRSILGRARSQS